MALNTTEYEIAPLVPVYSDWEMRNFRNGQIGGSERGAYRFLLSGSSAGTIDQFPKTRGEWVVTKHNIGERLVPISINNIRYIIPTAQNFRRMMNQRIGSFLGFSLQFQIWLHANRGTVSMAQVHAYFNALDAEIDEYIAAFERGYKDKVLVETGDASNDFRLAKGVTILEQIRQLADQDYNEYSAREIMQYISIIRREIEQLRQTFKS